MARETERRREKEQERAVDVEGRWSNTLGKGRQAQEDFWEVAERRVTEPSPIAPQNLP